MSDIAKIYLETLSTALKAASASLSNDASIVTVIQNMKNTFSQETLPKTTALDVALDEVFGYASDSVSKGLKNRAILDDLETCIMEVLKGYHPEPEAQAFILELVRRVSTSFISITYDFANEPFISLPDLAYMLDISEENIIYTMGQISISHKLDNHRCFDGTILIHEKLVKGILESYSPKVAKAFGDRNLF